MKTKQQQHQRKMPTNRRLVGREGADFYPTPPWAVRALLGMEEFDGEIFECACGDGAISKVLEEAGHEVFSSDLNDHGYGVSGVDFLDSTRTVPNIITNPPYNLAESFVKKGLELAEHKLALLLRLPFLEGKSRQIEIYRDTPPSRVLVFSERITFYRKGAEQRGSGTTAYAWFVWDKHAPDGTFIDWIPIGFKRQYFGSASNPVDPNQGSLGL